MLVSNISYMSICIQNTRLEVLQMAKCSVQIISVVVEKHFCTSEMFKEIPFVLPFFYSSWKIVPKMKPVVK